MILVESGCAVQINSQKGGAVTVAALLSVGIVALLVLYG